MPYSASINPHNERQLHVFGVSANQHLNLRDIDITGKLDDFKPDEVSDTTKLGDGIISNPSSIVSLPYAGWTRVYGWVDWKDNDENITRQLTMLSPVHSWLNVTTDNDSRPLAGASDGQDKGYLYYVDDNDVYELALGGGAPSQIEISGTLMTGSQLGATQGEDGRRYVAYQLKNKSIQVFNKSKDAALPKIHDSDMAMEKTPIAVVQYEKYGDDILDVYYIKSSGGYIVRSRRVGTRSDAEWQEQTIKDSGYLPAPSTSISAVWDPEYKKVILTYARKDGRLISFRDKDKWSSSD